MKNVTGLNKKIIAGMCKGLICLMLSAPAILMAAETTDAHQNDTVSTQSAVDTNSIQNLPAPSVNASVSTTSPVNTPKPAATKTDSASQLASVIGGLAIILVLIYGLSWFVKRFAQGGFIQSPAMKIISSMPLGTRERLMLVEVGDKQLLLGVTATQINTLHVFDEPVLINEKSQNATSDFSQKLMAILQKNQNPDIADKKSNS